jgi:probable blue pigment (indigoidine) exporter
VKGGQCRQEIASRNGIGLAFAATVFWAAGSLLLKDSLNYFAPLTLLPIELAASVCALGLLLCITPWKRPASLGMIRLSLPGLLQPGLAYTLSFVGLKWLDSVSVETLIWAAEGVLMLPFSVVFLGETVTARMLVLGIIALLGIGIVTVPAGSGTGASSIKLAGSALILAAVLSACWYTVLTQRDLRDNDPLLLTILHHSAALVVAMAFGFLTPWPTAASVISAATVAEACLSGVCLFAVPFWLYLRSLRLIGSASAAQFLPIVPIVTLIFARLLLHERLSIPQLLGSAVTIGAILVMAWRPRPC